MKSTEMYRTRLHVRGSGQFPLDMLRYDACVPDRQEDVFSVAPVTIHDRTVQLRRYAMTDAPATSDRWRSFGWTVVSEEPV